MRQVLVSLFVIGAFASDLRAFQTRGGAAGATPRIRACTLLPKGLAARVTTMNKQILDMFPPEEEPLGASGSACHYAGITLQIDPFAPARLDALYKERGKGWTPVPGVGDAAYFYENPAGYAELYARTGAHTFTIQLSIPVGGTPAAIKPNVLTLANAVVPKLRS